MPGAEERTTTASPEADRSYRQAGEHVGHDPSAPGEPLGGEQHEHHEQEEDQDDDRASVPSSTVRHMPSARRRPPVAARIAAVHQGQVAGAGHQPVDPEEDQETQAGDAGETEGEDVLGVGSDSEAQAPPDRTRTGRRGRSRPAASAPCRKTRAGRLPAAAGRRPSPADGRTGRASRWLRR